jgi:hypothetical protein
MNLEEFISQSLTDIANGVTKANQSLEKSQFEIEHYTRTNNGYITFDIAVTASQKGTKGASGGIIVWGVNVGGKLDEENQNQVVSRIKFSVIPSKPIR